MIARELRLLLVALQFLTRIPVPSFDGFDPSWLDRSAKYFPLVGALVGAISAFALLAAAAVFPEPVQVAIAITVGVLVTGAFHEDGLADTADGLGGGTTREARLIIMKDSRIGTYGAAALLLVLGLKASALIGMDPQSAAKALIAAHAFARLATVFVIAALPYAGDAEAAKVKPLATALHGREFAVALVLGLIPVFAVLATVTATVSILAALAAAIAVALVCRKLIGGYTGDTLGATEQVCETVFLLAAAAVISGPG